MIDQRRQPDRRRRATGGAGERICPWCRGRLALQPRFPLRQLIHGDMRLRPDEDIPEALRTVRAWVCSTPHCKFRETA